MYSLIVKKDGETFQLTDNSNYVVTNIDGLYPVKADITTAVIPGSDGERIKNKRRGKRNIVLTVVPEYPYEENRDKLYRFFAPKSSVSLYIKTDLRDVMTEGAVESCEITPFSERQEAQISIICPETFFKSVNAASIEWNSTISLFEFPVTFPEEGIAFSELAPMGSKRISGNENDTGLIIECRFISGAEDIIVYNLTHSERIKVTGSFEDGDILTINTNVASKCITLTRGDTEINMLDGMSGEWIRLYKGDNEFTYTCTSGRNNAEVTITADILYLGI